MLLVKPLKNIIFNTVETTTETKIEKRAKTTDVVNVRSSDSQEADKVGKAQKGDEFIVLEEKANGWSKIEYEGEEAFIKTEFLEVIEEKEVEVEAADEETDEEETKELQEETENDSNL